MILTKDKLFRDYPRDYYKRAIYGYVSHQKTALFNQYKAGTGDWWIYTLPSWGVEETICTGIGNIIDPPSSSRKPSGVLLPMCWRVDEYLEMSD